MYLMECTVVGVLVQVHERQFVAPAVVVGTEVVAAGIEVAVANKDQKKKLKSSEDKHER